MSHSADRDICLIGRRGEGKSFMVRLFAKALGYAPVEVVFLYNDMTSRDLLQRRTTSPMGETLWQPSPLLIAMTKGRLVVLDGLH